MVGLESAMDLAEAAKTAAKPEVNSAERERQRIFLEQLRIRKPAKVKATIKPKKIRKVTKARKGKRMTRARKGETYYCTVCGCEIICTADSKNPLICCDEVMYVF